MTAAAVSSGQDDLFFSAIVGSYIVNPRFLRRDWLAAEVEEKLRNPDCRFLLLTASPGAGKSTFMCQLAHDHPNRPVYFIRRDQRTPLADVGPHSFLLRIGYQLSALYPELFTPEAVKLVVEQRIGVVESGEAVGAEVKRVIASPFHQQIIRIRQQVERNNGSVVGLRVGEWVVDPRLIPLSDLQYLALIDPAISLAKLRPQETIVILVDALDELRYHQSDQTLLQWLTNCPQLPANTRFVLTSRPIDQMLMAFRDKQAPYLQTFALDTRRNHVVKDLETYAGRLVTEPAVASSLAQVGQDARQFSATVVAKANDSIGYLDALARGFDQAVSTGNQEALKELLSLKTLPDHLEGLYAFFLRQVHASVEKQSVEVEDAGDVHYLPAWPAVYKRVLGILAVARAPQTVRQIKLLGGIAANEDYVGHAINQLLQFVQIVDGHLRFYHATVAEFLTSPETGAHSETAVFYVDPPQWHGRIANYYWKSSQAGWASCDDYGLNHLATHLFEGRQHERLQGLISKEWMKARYDGAHDTHTGFLSDIDLAWRVAVSNENSGRPSLVRLQTARQLAHQQIATYSDLDLQTLAWLGKAATALAHARLRDDADGRFDGLLAVHTALKESGESDPAILTEAREEAGAISDVRVRVKALCRLSVELAGVADGDAREVLEAAYQGAMKPAFGSDLLQVDLAEAELIKDVALACGLTGDDRADRLFRQARELAEKLDDDPDRIAAPRWPAMLELAGALARTGRFADAENVARSIYSPLEAYEAFDLLVQALCHAARFDDAARVAGLIDGELVKVRALSTLAGALHAAGDSRSTDFFSEAYQIAGRMENGQRLNALGTVASAMAEASEGRADQVFAEARSLADGLKQVKRGSFEETAAYSRLQSFALALARAGRLSEAFEASRSTSLHYFSETWRNMALLLARKKDARAGKVFHEALEMVDQAQINWPLVTCELAQALAASGYPKQARELTSTIDLTRLSPMDLRELTESLALAGCYEEAEKVATAINYPPCKAEAFRKLSVVQARAGRWNDAERTVNQIEEQPQRVWATSVLAAELAVRDDARAARFFERAIESAESLPNGSESSEALAELAAALAQAGLYDRACQTCNRIDDARRKLQTVGVLARVAAQRGHVARAVDIACGIGDPYSRAAALRDLATVLAQDGRYDEAIQTAEGIRPARQAFLHAEALRNVAAAMARADRSRSSQLFQQARELAVTIEDRKDRANALLTLASAMADAGENADSVFEDARHAANRFNVVSNPTKMVLAEIDQKVAVLAELAVAMATAGHTRAGSVIGEARELAGSMIGTRVFWRDWALQKLSLAFALVGRYEESREATTLIPDLSSQVDSLRGTAIVIAKCHEARAREFFAEAYALVNRIATDSTRAEKLEKLATAQFEAGFFSDALYTMSPGKLDKFLLVLAEWAAVIERREPGSMLKMLYEAAGVAGWLRSDWLSIQPLLKTAAAAPESPSE